MSDRAVQLRITGRVQGVGYRAWTVHRARELGLRGWVRNRRDGSVEALIIGKDEQVEGMIEACREGPSFARVTHIITTDATDVGSTTFEARDTL